MSFRKRTLKITYTAIMAALLTGGKLAMSSFPNIEPVTLLLTVFSVVFGWQTGVAAALAFCLTQIALYGVGSWTVGYFLYWPSLAFVAGRALTVKTPLCYVLTLTLAGTVLFGFTDAFVWATFNVAAGSSAGFFKIFLIYYVNGAEFAALHIASTAATVGLLYVPLKKTLIKIAKSSGVFEFYKSRKHIADYSYRATDGCFDNDMQAVIDRLTKIDTEEIL